MLGIGPLELLLVAFAAVVVIAFVAAALTVLFRKPRC